MIRRQDDYIRTPWARRLRLARQSALPALCFAACILAAGWLWNRQGQLPNAVGEVEVVRIDIVAPADGVLDKLPRGPWTLLDRVEMGSLLARLDDRAIRAEMATLQAEVVRLRKELTAAAEQIALDEAGREGDHLRESRRLAWQLQQHRLDVLDRHTLIEADRVEEIRLDQRLKFLEPLSERGSITKMEITEQRLLRDEVTTRIGGNERALAEAQQQLAAALAALGAYPDILDAQMENLLGPVEAAITVGQRRLDELQVQLDSRQVLAPFRGTICAIHSWPGQHVRAGDPICTLAAEEGRHIVSYVRQEHRIRPVASMPVWVRLRGSRTRMVQSVVERVGPQVELVPLHQLRDPKTPEWGLPVCIQLPAELRLRPGQLIDITFQKSRTTNQSELRLDEPTSL